MWLGIAVFGLFLWFFFGAILGEYFCSGIFAIVGMVGTIGLLVEKFRK